MQGDVAASFNAALTTTAVRQPFSNRLRLTGWMNSILQCQLVMIQLNQRLSFVVDRTVLGSGTKSDFNSFTAYGSADQTGTNNLALTNADNAPKVPIRGGEVLFGDPFVATGEEIQPNDKRYGISRLEYNSELQNFSISSGTTGEAIAANGAIGVSRNKKRPTFRLVVMHEMSTGHKNTNNHMMLTV